MEGTVLTTEQLIQFLLGAFGGVAFLLYGLHKMSGALKSLAGEKLRETLAQLTKNRFSSLLTGAGVTAIVQSSAATTVMVVGFISAGLMRMPQSLGVILGADIGTTITVQIIAFKLNAYALFAVALGIFIRLAAKENERLKWMGQALMGIGLIFFGVKMISESMGHIREIPAVLDLLTHLSSPLMAIVIGGALTALMQSSAAAMAIFIALADQGFLTLPAALCLMLGANIGTCLTAILASWGKPREAVRAAAAHLMFKIIGVTATLLIFGFFAELAVRLTTGSSVLPELASPRLLANSHSLFNVLLAAICLPFVHKFAQFLFWAIPVRKEEEGTRPRFLENSLLSTPSLALNAVRNEINRVEQRVVKMGEGVLNAVTTGAYKDLSAISHVESEVDALYTAIIKYLARISRHDLSEHQSRELVFLMNHANNLENIGDIIGRELVRLGRKRLRRNVKVSEKTHTLLADLHSHVHHALTLSIEAAQTMQKRPAKRTLTMKRTHIQPAARKSLERHEKRLIAPEDKRFDTYSIETDIVDLLQRTYYHTRRVARNVEQYLTPNT